MVVSILEVVEVEREEEDWWIGIEVVILIDLAKELVRDPEAPGDTEREVEV